MVTELSSAKADDLNSPQDITLIVPARILIKNIPQSKKSRYYINYYYFCVFVLSQLRITAEIVRSWIEYQSLPDREWRKDYFSWETGGYVATHKLKARDNTQLKGIKAEVHACLLLAVFGKKVLRLPENVADKIDIIKIGGRPYRDLLKFKPKSNKPRGYPDAYFDEQTWDFKTSTYQNEDSLRQVIKEGRKADNLVFMLSNAAISNLTAIKTAIGREYGSRAKDDTWIELPTVYYLSESQLIKIWEK